MKQLILPSTILEFRWLVIDGFIEENGLAPLSQKGAYTEASQAGLCLNTFADLRFSWRIKFYARRP